MTSIRLLEVHPCLFRVFYHWLHTRHLDWSRAKDGAEVLALDSRRANILLHCYLLGDTFGATKFKNDIMDQLVLAGLEERILPNMEAITLVYNKIAPSSKLRKLMVDMWIDAVRRGAIAKLEAATLPEEFSLDCFKSLATAIWDANRYDYTTVRDMVDMIHRAGRNSIRYHEREQTQGASEQEEGEIMD